MKKNLFFSQSETHTAKLCFSVVFKHFVEIHRELLFLVKKWLSEKRTEILRTLVFLNIFEKAQIQRKIWICLNNSFWSDQYKGTNINKNCFSPQSEPHSAKLCFSVVLKHFRGNSQRTSLLSPKSPISEKSTEILRKVVFLNMFEKGQILRKFGFV